MEDHLDRGQAQCSMKRLSPQWAAQNHPESLTPSGFFDMSPPWFSLLFLFCDKERTVKIKRNQQGYPFQTTALHLNHYKNVYSVLI